MFKNSIKCITYKKNQLFFRKQLKKARVLLKNSQKKGLVNKLVLKTPRKPNSARRKSIRSLYSSKKVVISYVPGGLSNLKKFSNVLLHGRDTRDLPGIYTRAVPGVLDFQYRSYKAKRRSLYGIKKLLMLKTLRIKPKNLFIVKKKIYKKKTLNLSDVNRCLWVHNGTGFSYRKIFFFYNNKNIANYTLLKKTI